MNKTRLTSTIDDRRMLRPMPAAEAHIDEKSWADALPLWEFRQWPTPRYKSYGYWWLVEYGFGSWDIEDGITFGCFLFLSSLLFFFGSRPGTNGIGMGFYHLRSQSSGGGVSQCTRSAERSPLSCSDRLWDLWVRTIAYVGWLFRSLFPFPSFLSDWLWQPRRSAPKVRDNITARLHVTCPGLGNGHSI